MDKVSHLDGRRLKKRMAELDQQLDRQKEELLAWMKEYFAGRPAPSKSYQALLMAEMLRLAQEPELCWRIKDPVAFMGEVAGRVQENLAETIRVMLEEMVGD